jgi:Transposase DDE domain
LDATTLDQIQQACLKQTQTLEEADCPKNGTDDDQKPDLPGPGPRTVNQKYQSSTDPEATLVRQQGVKTRPQYKNHRVVDDAHGIVTAVKTTTGSINEGHELMGLIDQHQANGGVSAYTIIADCKYGTIENYVACQSRKLRTHMADLLASSPGSGRRDGIYPESQFLYRPERDTFLCPAGQVMKPRRLHSVRLSWEYVTKRGVCLSCTLGSTVSSWNRTRRHLMRNAEPLAQSSGSPVPAFP